MLQSKPGNITGGGTLLLNFPNTSNASVAHKKLYKAHQNTGKLGFNPSAVSCSEWHTAHRPVRAAGDPLWRISLLRKDRGLGGGGGFDGEGLGGGSWMGYGTGAPRLAGGFVAG